MRKLALFSFSFAAGVLPVLLGASVLLTVLLAGLLLTAMVVGFLLKGRNERIAAICAMGALCGLLWSFAYDGLIVRPVEQLTGEDCEVSVLLAGYPKKTAYGWSAEGIAERDGTRFRTYLYLSEEFPGETVKPGDCVTGTGNILPADDGESFGYHRSVGVLLRTTFYTDVTVESAGKLPIRFWPAVLSERFRQTARELYPDTITGYVVALLTGDKSELTFRQQTDLQIAGVYHALAVSGMHVSILMSMLAVVTMKNRRLYPILGIPLLVVYCMMIGGTPSVIRASVMHVFLMLAHLVRRESDSPTALGASLLVLTIQNPWCLFHTGLQLSFLATAGILAFCPRFFAFLTKKHIRKFRRVRSAVAAVIACSASALTLTLPVMTFRFGVISTLGILSNLLVLQAITIAFAMSFLSCFGAWIAPGLGTVLACPVTWLLQYMDFCCRWIAGLPFAALYPDSLYLVLWFWTFYGLSVCLLLRGKPVKLRTLGVLGGCAAVTLCVMLCLNRADVRRGTFSFQALDVGQGQCLLYRSGDSTAVVDCGSDYGDQTGETLARTLLSGGDRELDLLILTHYDLDHVGGVEQLLNRVRVHTILMPDTEKESPVRQNLEQLAMSAGSRVVWVSEDLSYVFGNGSIDVFAPLHEDGGNNAGLCVLASFDTFDILVTGDLPVSQELALLKEKRLPDIEVMTAGHHGSESSTGALMLQVLRPEILVISVGENRYGHPSAEVLERAASIGAEIYRTDLNGTVTIRR